MPLKTRPMPCAPSPEGEAGEGFALEVLDLDLSRPEPGQVEALQRLWEDHPLLFLRRQSLTEGELVGLARQFGEPDILVRDDMLSPTHPEVIYVTNLMRENGERLGGLGSYELSWHTDQIYRERPPTGSLFYAVEMPEGGPQTWWCDTQAAHDALPETMRRDLAGLRVTCKYGLRQDWGFQRDIAEGSQAQSIHDRTPPVTHPLVLTHPVSGKRSLYFDPRKTVCVEGWDETRSQALIRELFAHITRPEFVHRHSWRPGDVVLWDNARTLHRRDPFDGALPRLAKRATIHLPSDRFPMPVPAAP